MSVFPQNNFDPFNLPSVSPKHVKHFEYLRARRIAQPGKALTKSGKAWPEDKRETVGCVRLYEPVELSEALGYMSQSNYLKR